MINIEKGVQMPQTKSAYPFAQMEVNDSFLMEGQTNSRSMTMAINTYKKNNQTDAQYEAHVVENGVRVWRTA